MSLQSFLKRIL
nr:unnamed protein product [Callosobruchus chinensis]